MIVSRVGTAAQPDRTHQAGATAAEFDQVADALGTAITDRRSAVLGYLGLPGGASGHRAWTDEQRDRVESFGED